MTETDDFEEWRGIVEAAVEWRKAELAEQSGKGSLVVASRRSKRAEIRLRQYLDDYIAARNV